MYNESLAYTDSSLSRRENIELRDIDKKIIEIVNQSGFYELGEAYVRGEWNSQNLDALLATLFIADLPNASVKRRLKVLDQIVRHKFLKPQKSERAFNIADKHYNLGNNLFSNMLDSSLTYTSGYWRNTDSFEAAQEAKLKLVCEKLELVKGMKVLDIGCGWGNFAQYAASKYGVTVTGVTVSKEQAHLAKERCKGLPVEILIQDYRKITGTFDAVISIEMIEAVGKNHLTTFFDTVHRLLKNGGLFLLETISAESFTFSSNSRLDEHLIWILKYIFPEGYLPNSKELAAPCASKFALEDWHSFGPDYDKTLMSWAENFNNNWSKLDKEYDQTFKRIWNYYLYSCAALFRTKIIHLYQIVYSKPLRSTDYFSIR